MKSAVRLEFRSLTLACLHTTRGLEPRSCETDTEGRLIQHAQQKDLACIIDVVCDCMRINLAIRIAKGSPAKCGYPFARCLDASGAPFLLIATCCMVTMVITCAVHFTSW